MSFHHKAYEFDWDQFLQELAPLLERALTADDSSLLRQFIANNVKHCANPYDGESLESDWESQLEIGDVQELADFALTKYYLANDDAGVGHVWGDLETSLNPAQKQALLGKSFGPADNPFDPGRQGSYFKTPAEVEQSFASISSLNDDGIGCFRDLLARSITSGKGLYVTF
jgi:hypothetical protein